MVNAALQRSSSDQSKQSCLFVSVAVLFYVRGTYNYLYNKCLSPLMLWVRISIRARSTTLCDEVCQWLATGRWFSPNTPGSSINKTDRHDITEILLKVALSNTKQTNVRRTSYSTYYKHSFIRSHPIIELLCYSHTTSKRKVSTTKRCYFYITWFQRLLF